ncbi:hypothetical protein ACLOJK_019646, partial [Asimina triloba]
MEPTNSWPMPNRNQQASRSQISHHHAVGHPSHDRATSSGPPRQRRPRSMATSDETKFSATTTVRSEADPADDRSM